MNRYLSAPLGGHIRSCSRSAVSEHAICAYTPSHPLQPRHVKHEAALNWRSSAAAHRGNSTQDYQNRPSHHVTKRRPPAPHSRHGERSQSRIETRGLENDRPAVFESLPTSIHRYPTTRPDTCAAGSKESRIQKGDCMRFLDSAIFFAKLG